MMKILLSLFLMTASAFENNNVTSGEISNEISGKLACEVSLKGQKVFVAGHKGMVGSALLRRLEQENCKILTVDREDCDLTRQDQVEAYFEKNKPDYVFLAAAKVGGIQTNIEKPAEFIYNNLMIESNIIHSSYQNNVKKILFLGSSCIYPRMSKQPMAENELLKGELEPTNQFYSIAKISGIKLCEAYRKQYQCDYISAMPSNLYGCGDNFGYTGHVLASILKKIHNSKVNDDKTVEVWGTGNQRREFLHVDDAADAFVFLMKNYSSDEIINVGYGEDITIKDLAFTISEIIDYKGKILFNTSKPDGMAKKCVDISKIKQLGWYPKISLSDGIKATYNWYTENLKNGNLKKQEQEK